MGGVYHPVQLASDWITQEENGKNIYITADGRKHSGQVRLMQNYMINAQLCVSSVSFPSL